MSVESVTAAVYFLIAGTIFAVLAATSFVQAMPDKYGRDPANSGLKLAGAAGLFVLTGIGPWLPGQAALSIPARIAITAATMALWAVLTTFMLAAKGRRF